MCLYRRFYVFFIDEFPCPSVPRYIPNTENHAVNYILLLCLMLIALSCFDSKKTFQEYGLSSMSEAELLICASRSARTGKCVSM